MIIKDYRYIASIQTPHIYRNEKPRKALLQNGCILIWWKINFNSNTQLTLIKGPRMLDEFHTYFWIIFYEFYFSWVSIQISNSLRSLSDLLNEFHIRLWLHILHITTYQMVHISRLWLYSFTVSVWFVVRSYIKNEDRFINT